MKTALILCPLAFVAGLVFQDPAPDDEPEEPKPWARFAMAEVEEARVEAEETYRGFFQNRTMSLGLYHVAADAADRQSPHSMDEAYYVLSGEGKLRVEGEDVDVAAGDVLFVQAGAEHRFHGLTEDLSLLVFFSQAKPEVWKTPR